MKIDIHTYNLVPGHHENPLSQVPELCIFVKSRICKPCTYASAYRKVHTRSHVIQLASLIERNICQLLSLQKGTIPVLVADAEEPVKITFA